jgi:hypothetical protein
LPRVTSLKWGPNRLSQFRDWITHEIACTQGDRAALERKWADQLIQWRAALPRGEKDFPWPGASNIELPLTAIHSDPVYANIMQTLHAPEEYWGFQPKRPDRTEHSNPLREFTAAVERNFIEMRKVNRTALLDMVVHGTAIYKNHWRHEKRAISVRGLDGTIEKQPKIISQPQIERVPLQYFYIPANAWDIDPDAPVGGAQWVAQKFYLRVGQFNERAKDEVNGYNRQAAEQVRKFAVTSPDPTDEQIQKQEEYEPFSDEKIQLFEVHARFDYDGDGAEEDIIAIVHAESGIVLKATLSPFLHGKRPFHRDIYLPTFSFYGQGMAEIDEWAQQTGTQLINALVDNTLVANTRMYSAPFGSTLRPGEPIYPGRVINTQPGEQVQALQLGEVYPSLPNLIQMISQFAEMRTAVPEIRQGNMSNLPGRTPATTVMTMMQEGNKRFDMVLSNLRMTHGEMGLRMLQNIAQFYHDEPERWMQFCNEAVGPDDAMKVVEILSASPHDIEAQFGVSVSATSAMVNKEADKQNYLAMMQTLIPMYQQAIQTQMMAMQMPPGSPPSITANAAYTAIVELIRRMLEKFDIQNPQAFLGQMDDLAASMSPPEMGMQPGMGIQMPMSPYPMQQAPIDPIMASIMGMGR